MNHLAQKKLDARLKLLKEIDTLGDFAKCFNVVGYLQGFK
jgi:hypothetical protein